MVLSMLDTNLCVRALRDRPAYIRARLEDEAASVSISTIVLYELYVGAELSDQPRHQLEVVDDFAARLQVLHFDEAASAHSANIRSALKKQGQLIGANDLLIAGHARSKGLKLITGNLKEFRRVDGLLCEDWLDV